MNSVIDVKDLSKKYLISHSAQDKNQSFREMLTGKVTTLFNPKSQKSNTEEFWALKDVSFQIDRGERVGIIGRNGAGKSTLLKVLSRITEPTEGKIKINGRISSLLEVGTGFHPELTGRENIYLNGTILGMSRKEIQRKFNEIVNFAEIEKFLDTPVKRYSSGMYVRLAFAIAAHLDPDILIIDEVLAVGDYAFQQKCIGKMEEVSEGGRTILFVSHNMDTIKHFCSRCILLEKGKILIEGNTEDVVRRYVSKTFEMDNSNPVITKDSRIKDDFPFISSLGTKNTSGLYASIFQRGEKMKISIQTNNKSQTDYGVVYFIHNISTQPLYVGASYMHGQMLKEGQKNIEISFDTTTLHPGRYYLRIVLHFPGRDVFDEWDYMTPFDIQSKTEHDEKWRECEFANDKWTID